MALLVVPESRGSAPTAARHVQGPAAGWWRTVEKDRRATSGQIRSLKIRVSLTIANMTADPIIGRRLFVDGIVRPVLTDDCGHLVRRFAA